MIKHTASHLDHHLTDAQVAFVFERFADKQAFFIETIELPEALGTVPCGLFGPIMGDAPVDEADVTYAKRGTREWNSRLVERSPRAVRTVTVIAGPHEETCMRCSADAGAWNLLHRAACPDCGGTQKIEHTCIVYTMFGGPLAPQEPDDPGCKDVLASRTFWTIHALAR